MTTLPQADPRFPGRPAVPSPSMLEARTQELGRRLFQQIENQKASIFDTSHWTGRLMSWAMSKPEFRLRLLRFVDTFPTVRTPEQLQRLIQEYFAEGGDDIPAVFKAGVQSSGMLGRAGHSVLGMLLRRNLSLMAEQFIAGAGPAKAIRRVQQLRGEGYAFVLDLLGESVVSELEASQHQEIYLSLLDELARTEFKPLGGRGNLDWGSQPIPQVSIKPSALYSKASAMDFDGSVTAILNRLKPIAAKAMATHAALCLDMESYALKEITLEVFRRLRQEPGFQSYPHFGVVLQAYLRDTEGDLRKLLAWMREHQAPSSIRLVKGAYWDYETVIAAQNGWPSQVWEQKAQTDVNFEKCSRILLENSDICYFACGSHNLRSIAAVLALAESLNTPAERYEFQVLYGMAEPVRQAIHKQTGRVRLYAPFGELIPGMAYLVRRILENTANESFLRHTFGEKTDTAKLMRNPAELLRPAEPAHEAPAGGFTNFPTADFTQENNREAMRAALASLRLNQLGKLRPLYIDGADVTLEAHACSLNPNHPSEELGRFCLAGKAEAESAIAAAKRAYPAWSALPVKERAKLMHRAAAICERRRWELAAWQVLEVGKQWNEATADVAEAIDFLHYYAAEAERLDRGGQVMQLPGEENRLFYVPRGVATVIAPWNFPLAISMGMAAAALVTGNTVVYKPSSLSALVGYHLVEIFREAGLPAGAFNYIPGRGAEIGDLLVDHPDIATIAFTGSVEVGQRILERAAKVQPGQRHVKRVIAEMGGKNAIIIDEDADLDEAIPAVLQSAFGFQGQKCSACSRVIVLDSVYAKFVDRLVAAARSWIVGPSEDPSHHMGAVVDSNALKKVRDYALMGALEGTVLYSSATPEADGYFAPLTIVGDIRPDQQLAREEIFGPVLAVMRAANFDQAIKWANATPYALTGGLFSRTPSHLEKAKREFEVGNLYLNRGITGAIVGRQPFGGAAMSGVGSKAGGPDYLLQFLNPRATTENTMRRGFAPEV